MSQYEIPTKIYKIFSPKLNPNLEIVISPISKLYLHKIAQDVTQIFQNYEPFCHASGTPSETLINQTFIPICSQSIEDQLSLVAINKENGEFIATLWSQDRTSIRTPPEEFDPSQKEVFQLMKELRDEGLREVEVPVKKYEQIHIVIACLNQKYSKLDITSELVKYLLQEHELTRETRLFFVEATNERSIKMFQHCGFETVVSRTYDDLRINKKFKSVQMAEEAIKNKVLDIAKTYNFMMFWTMQH